MVAACLVLLGMAIPRPVRAAACDGAENQMDLTICAQSEQVASDKKLNQTYAQVLARLEGDRNSRQRQALRDAERAWIGFRDAECRFETAASLGGSVHSMQLAFCTARLTDDRTKSFARMLACHDGGGSCVLNP